jgi:hypothetical protein
MKIPFTDYKWNKGSVSNYTEEELTEEVEEKVRDLALNTCKANCPIMLPTKGKTKKFEVLVVSLDEENSKKQELFKKDPNMTVGQEMQIPYNVAAYMVRARLREQGLSLKLIEIEKLTNHNVIVIEGCYDHMHYVLKACNIPFTKVNHQTFSTMDISDIKIVFLNCGGHTSLNRTKLRQFVDNGGLLLSSDWAITMIAEAFPGTIRHNNYRTEDEVIKITDTKKDDCIVNGFNLCNNTQWWLEQSSFPIQIVDRRVEVLARSNDLASKYKDDAVIVKFKHGKGHVYHIISHFFQQKYDKTSLQSGVEFAASMNCVDELLDDIKQHNLTQSQLKTAYTSVDMIYRVIINHVV